jgi:hypothetical protein
MNATLRRGRVYHPVRYSDAHAIELSGVILSVFVSTCALITEC